MRWITIIYITKEGQLVKYGSLLGNKRNCPLSLFLRDIFNLYSMEDCRNSSMQQCKIKILWISKRCHNYYNISGIVLTGSLMQTSRYVCIGCAIKPRLFHQNIFFKLVNSRSILSLLNYLHLFYFLIFASVLFSRRSFRSQIFFDSLQVQDYSPKSIFAIQIISLLRVTDTNVKLHWPNFVKVKL